MRATASNSMQTTASSINQAPATPSPVQVEAGGIQTSNLQENLETANNTGYGSILWLLLFGGIYLFFDWIQTRDSVQTALEPSNMRANAHNILIV